MDQFLTQIKLHTFDLLQFIQILKKQIWRIIEEFIGKLDENKSLRFF